MSEPIQGRAGWPVAREGWPFILTPLALALILAAAQVLWPALFFFGLSCFVLYFFRDPERTFTVAEDDEEDWFISPADGKVLFAGRTADSPLLGRPSQKISIFMSVFDVHVNRAPAAGRITALRYVPGRFFNASFDKASESNERLHLVLKPDRGEEPLELVQIAGLVARRIVCWARVGDGVEAGERFGLIRFGSRVDLYLPLETELQVRFGQRVRAGETRLGKVP